MCSWGSVCHLQSKYDRQNQHKVMPGPGQPSRSENTIQMPGAGQNQPPRAVPGSMPGPGQNQPLRPGNIPMPVAGQNQAPVQENIPMPGK